MVDMQMIHVLAIDAEPLARAGLVQIVNSQKDLRICAEADTISKAGTLAQQHRPHVAVLDPLQAGGFAFLKDVAKWSRGTRVVAVSAAEEAAIVQRTFQFGALGYISRRDPVAAAIEAIRSAAAGERFLGPRAQKILLGGLAHGAMVMDEGEVRKLSQRERDVFRLIGQGRGTRSIAEELGVSAKTIETHRQRIREKLGVKSGAELARRAVLALSLGIQEAARTLPSL